LVGGAGQVVGRRDATAAAAGPHAAAVTCTS
jgi:hypothetical protein